MWLYEELTVEKSGQSKDQNRILLCTEWDTNDQNAYDEQFVGIAIK